MLKHKIMWGRHHYGEAIGIITLDTPFMRIPGDIGNATTFPFPVRFRVVKGASVDRVVKKGDKALLKPFILAAQELESDGVRAITTSCGFLILFQEEMAEAVSIPVFTSSLLQIPLVHKMLGSKGRIGIITADASSLTLEHLRKAGVNESIPIAISGLEDVKEFSEWILNPPLEQPKSLPDPEKVKQKVVEKALNLLKEYPDIQAWVFECANLPPYSKAVQDATNLPVFDIVTLTTWVYHAVVQKEYKGYL
ncbi:MAG: aspartate/glutamate racemase family protein [Nitrososphaerales archaeon]